MNRSLPTVACVGLLAFFCSTAQGAIQAGVSGSGPALEEIIVTATKREVSVHDVPVSMSVTSGEELNNLSINNLEELSGYLPNLTIADTAVTTNIYMRGIGSGLDRGFEQSVGLFVDGVYMGRSKQYRAPMFDVDRIEVLRGPQPVLFGKNTTAGAIKVETRKPRPGQDWEAEVSAEHEFEYSGNHYTGAIAGSPTETLGLRFAATYEESDGYLRNTLLDRDEPSTEQWLARVTGVWEPVDGASVTLKYEHADFRLDGALGEASKIGQLEVSNALTDEMSYRLLFGPNGVYALDPQVDDRLDFRRSSDDVMGPQGGKQKVDNVALTLEKDLENHVLTAVLGYSAYDYALGNDIDFLPVPMTYQYIEEDFSQTSAEIRLASDTDGRIDYMIGLYWQDNSLDMRPVTKNNFAYVGPIFPPPSGTTVISSIDYRVGYYLDTRSTSGFAQVSWEIAEDVSLTLGGRYGKESKDVIRTSECLRLDGSPFDVVDNPSDNLVVNVLRQCPDIVSYSNDRDESHFMPSAQLQWNATDDVMMYAKWDRSYKSGGFNAGTRATLADIEYDEERATGYEVGIKTRFADNAATINVAAFDTKFDDMQVTTIVGAGQTVLSNAGAATTRGVEFDGAWAVTDWMTVGGSGAYLDAAYDEYSSGPCTADQRALAGLAGVPCFQDLTGKTTAYAPEWTANLFTDMSFDVSSSFILRLRLDAGFTDEYFYDADLDPNTRQSSFWRYGARVSLADAGDRWELSLLGKNLSNEKIAVWGTDVGMVPGSYFAFTEMPRTVALQARYRFGMN